jgi:ATP synthase protein I
MMPFNPPIPEPKGRGKPTGQSKGLVSAIVQAEKMVQIALILPCAAFIGWLLGDWIGSREHWPLAAAVGVAFGGAAGLFYVVRMAMDAVKEPTGKGKPNGKGSAGRPS